MSLTRAEIRTLYLPPYKKCPSLNRLPLEVVMEVLVHLRPAGPLTSCHSSVYDPDVVDAYIDARSTFARLCLVSRQMRALAHGHLYRTVVITSLFELVRFFHVFVNNPSLRPLVSSLAWAGSIDSHQLGFDGWDWTFPEAAYFDRSCWEATNMALVPDSLCDQLGLLEPGGSVYWKLLGAVLAMAPNLESVFSLHHTFRSGMAVECPSNSLFQQLLNAPAPFRNDWLQGVHTVALESDAGLPPSQLAESLVRLLPHIPIRRLHLKNRFSFGSIIEAAQRRGQLQFSIPSLRELIVFGAASTLEDLAHVDSMFPGLTTLDVSLDRPQHVAAPGFALRFSGSLARLSDTLRRLVVVCDPAGGPGGFLHEGPSDEPLLPALGHMTSLRHLGTSYLWLLGTRGARGHLEPLDTLPMSLVSFTLYDNWDDDRFADGELYVEVLDRLHANRRRRLPRLRLVTMVLLRRFHAMHAERLAMEFGPLFRLGGIELRVLCEDEALEDRYETWGVLG